MGHTGNIFLKQIRTCLCTTITTQILTRTNFCTNPPGCLKLLSSQGVWKGVERLLHFQLLQQQVQEHWTSQVRKHVPQSKVPHPLCISLLGCRPETHGQPWPQSSDGSFPQYSGCRLVYFIVCFHSLTPFYFWVISKRQSSHSLLQHYPKITSAPKFGSNFHVGSLKGYR